MYALHFRDKIRSLALWSNFEIDLETNLKIEDFTKSQKNRIWDKIWIWRSNAFNGPPKFIEASN